MGLICLRLEESSCRRRRSQTTVASSGEWPLTSLRQSGGGVGVVVTRSCNQISLSVQKFTEVVGYKRVGLELGAHTIDSNSSSSQTSSKAELNPNETVK